jgi:hypothetical protein
LHRPSGQAVVTLQGRDYYLGAYQSLESRDRYRRLVSEYLAGGGTAPHQIDQEDGSLLVAELIAAYVRHTDSYYVHDGKPTSQAMLVRLAMGVLKRLHGHLLVSEYGPLRLLEIQQALIQSGLSRTECNRRVNLIRACFRWAVSRELAPPSLAHALATVEPLRAGRCQAPETDPVRPVHDGDVDKALPFMPKPVAAIVRLQQFTGMRPGEVLGMHTSDVDTSTDP